MSRLFNKKFASQQDIEQGQVPDHLSDQPAPNPQILPQQQPEPLISHPQEDQFIFETLPDNHFESDYPKDKNHHKTQDYHLPNQSSQKKDRDRQDRYDRDKRQDKNASQKQSLKKQTYNQDNKKKPEPQDDPQMRPSIVGSVPPVPIGYYPGMASLIGNPYTPQAYYPPYGSITQAQTGTRPPYGMYPQLHHQPPSGIYAPPPQNMYPVPNPNIYQIPSPPIAYGSIQPMVQPMPPEMYHPQMVDPLRNMNDQGKPYPYDQQRSYPENPSYNNKKSQKQYQNRDKQDQRQKNYKEKQSDNRYPDERQRSRDKKDRHDSEITKGQQKQKNYDRKSSYDQNTKERSKDQKSQNQRASVPRETKKVKQDEDKLKIKVNINDQLRIIFANNQQAKEEFLLVLRDVIKHKLLKKEEEQMEKFNGFELARPTAVYSLNKDLIESNYNKALLKIENLLITLAQTDSKSEGHSSAVDKKDALIFILTSLQIQDLVSKVKEMRLKKKLLGERKMSDIKKILDELVKDPRKKIK